MTTRYRGTPIVFIHGMWLHASSWQPWVKFFETEGYKPVAPGWPGEPEDMASARAAPELVANRGIEDLSSHFRQIANAQPTSPILIGHSFGGLIAQKLLGEGIARAAIAINPAQIKGVLPLPFSQLRAGLPALGNPFNKSRSVALTAKQFRYGFGNALQEDESNELFEKWTIPSPARGLFEVAFANFNPRAASAVNTANFRRGPLLVTSGCSDHTVPDVTSRATHRQYRNSSAVTDLKQFAGKGHSLVIDHGWRDVATACLDWLRKQGM
ncbi:alpha/beta hydrolase [Paucibacter sp. R3-3]|uniref:Alpha/beta hydrolase n=1 Tax=Roseateles agri TaxID=3098619 RepID=A0ABU5DRS1_9BURK|nr:alpha/beta hydrolase [Paucibacter sp. R3-3]MDY0749018.1 alpha/beta hydrolase [Paucibacter sp. R3-3]